MRDVIVIGAGLAGLSAAWRLRHWNIEVLEAADRGGGRVQSERRGRYWLNWGGHVYAGPGTSTDELFREVGIQAVDVPGSLTGMSLNGKFLPRGSVATFPFRFPMPLRARVATMTTGARIMKDLILGYLPVARTRAGETGAIRQQRIYDFENERTFEEYLGASLPEDTRALFATTVTRSSGNLDQVSAGSGIGYFNLVLGIGQGLNRAIVGGPSTLTETIAASLGDRLRLGAEVVEVVEGPESVTVRYRQDGRDVEAVARMVVMATTADVAHRVCVNLSPELRGALGEIRYGPYVSTAFLTNERTPQHWDDVYAIAAPKRSFAIALNQASVIRGSEHERQPGGSFMTFSPAELGRRLLDSSDEQVVDAHQRDLDAVLGGKLAGIVTEAKVRRWAVGGPYCFPGRAKLQSALVRGSERVLLAGDYLGTLYTESAITSGFAAATQIGSRLGTDRQHGHAVGGRRQEGVRA